MTAVTPVGEANVALQDQQILAARLDRHQKLVDRILVGGVRPYHLLAVAVHPQYLRPHHKPPNHVPATPTIHPPKNKHVPVHPTIIPL